MLLSACSTTPISFQNALERNQINSLELNKKMMALSAEISRVTDLSGITDRKHIPRISYFNEEDAVYYGLKKSNEQKSYYYNFNHRTIIITHPFDDYFLSDEEKIALLAHEMTHYLQHREKVLPKLECVAALEKDAYKVQFHFLKKAGYSITEEYNDIAEDSSLCKKTTP
jgi:hypothetical protein